MPAREAPSRRLCSRASGRGVQLLDLVRPAEPVGEPDRLGRVSGAIVDQHPRAGRLRAAARPAAAVPAAAAVRLLQLDLPRHLWMSLRGGLEAARPPLAGALRSAAPCASAPSPAPGWQRIVSRTGPARKRSSSSHGTSSSGASSSRVGEPSSDEARARARARERLEAGRIRLPLESVPELRVLVLLVHELRGERPPGLRVERREMQQLRAPGPILAVAGVPVAGERAVQPRARERLAQQLGLRGSLRALEAPDPGHPLRSPAASPRYRRGRPRGSRGRPDRDRRAPPGRPDRSDRRRCRSRGPRPRRSGGSRSGSS